MVTCSGSNVKWAKLKLLDRPHPLAVAGTPQSWTYDPGNGSFVLRFSTRGAAGRLGSNETVVWVPPMSYPHGYGAKASGARIVSAPNASPLVLRTRPGARSVTLVIVR